MGGVGSSSFTLTLPTLKAVSTTIGTIELVSGITTVTVSGAWVAGAGLLGGAIMFAKPNSGRIRYSDDTGIDPKTGKYFSEKDEAIEYYKSIKDPKSKLKWKKWLKGKGWYHNHLK